jgi:hypothetical protein
MIGNTNTITGIAKGATVRHKKTGGLYEVLDDAIIKLDGVWRECISYKSLDKTVDKIFVRLVENFRESFECIQ